MARTRVFVHSLLVLYFVSLLDFYPAMADPNAKAQSLYQSGQYQAAVDLLQPQIEKLGRDDLFLLAQAQSKLGQDTLALKTLQSIVSIEPKDYAAKYFIADLQLKSKKEREAINTLKEIIEVNPKYEAAYLLMAKIYEQKKNRYELRTIYVDMIDRLGEKSAYVAKVCELATLDGLYEMSAQYCRRGMKINPKEPQNYVYYGQTLQFTGKLDAAEDYLKKAADIFSTSETAQMAYAQFLDERKRYLQSTTYYERALNTRHTNNTAWLGLAQARFEIQKYDAALVAFKESCRFSRQTTNLLRKNVNILRQLKQNEWSQKYEQQSDNCTGQLDPSADQSANKSK